MRTRNLMEECLTVLSTASLASGLFYKYSMTIVVDQVLSLLPVFFQSGNTKLVRHILVLHSSNDKSW